MFDGLPRSDASLDGGGLQFWRVLVAIPNWSFVSFKSIWQVHIQKMLAIISQIKDEDPQFAADNTYLGLRNVSDVVSLIRSLLSSVLTEKVDLVALSVGRLPVRGLEDIIGLACVLSSGTGGMAVQPCRQRLAGFYSKNRSFYILEFTACGWVVQSWKIEQSRGAEKSDKW